MKAHVRATFLALGLAALGCGAAGSEPRPPESPAPPQQAEPPEEPAPLIAREVIFGNPDRTSPRLSPDGKWLSYLAPDEGVLNVWVAPSADPKAAKPVTKDRGRGVRRYRWAYTSQHVLYLQDKGGDENWRLYSVDLESGKELDLTPLEGAQARIQHVSHKHPKEVLVGLNDRNKKFHDVHRIDVTTGKRTLVQRNDEFGSFVTDDELAVRMASKPTDDGGEELLVRDKKAGWTTWAKISMEDSLNTGVADFAADGKAIYMIDSRGRDTAGLTKVDLATKKSEALADDTQADITQVLVHPTSKKVQAAAAVYDHKRWFILDPTLKDDFAKLAKESPGDVDVVSRTLDDRRWIVAYNVDTGPVRYYLYDRDAKAATFLFVQRKELEGLQLAAMRPVIVPSRDGKKLVSYVSFPPGAKIDGEARPEKPYPLVLFVHGGPWSRDRWGYHPYHQWLANRGYAVMSVNYRGSVGFGKAFVNAANREWSGKMHDDLIDAVDWAIKRGIAPKDKVAIMGGSYGGYATLVGLTFTPKRFACGVDIVGPSNLVTLLESIPPYWAPYLALFKVRVGDHTTEAGKKDLLARSPISRVDQIERPLLIGQGANDPRVKQAESDQIVAAMQAKNIPVTYVLYPDEGHGFARPQNRTSFNAVAEGFLASCLGGRSEPFGSSFEGASLKVPVGAEHVPGLSAAIGAK